MKSVACTIDNHSSASSFLHQTAEVRDVAVLTPCYQVGMHGWFNFETV